VYLAPASDKPAEMLLTTSLLVTLVSQPIATGWAHLEAMLRPTLLKNGASIGNSGTHLKPDMDAIACLIVVPTSN
jgi:hypothetical protein